MVGVAQAADCGGALHALGFGAVSTQWQIQRISHMAL